MDSLLYANPGTGRIRLRIDSDPFTDAPLIKGKEYYFSITTYTLNHKSIKNLVTGTYGSVGDYFDPVGGALGEYETQILRVTFGKDLYNPANNDGNWEKVSGGSKGEIKYIVVNKQELTGDTYQIDFFKDDKADSKLPYLPFWKLIMLLRTLF